MQKFLKAVGVGLVAVLLYLLDSCIAPFLISGASFLWIAFVYWGVFSQSTLKDRLEAIPGLITGFFCALLMSFIGGAVGGELEFGNIIIVLGVVLGVFLVNVLVMLVCGDNKFKLGNVPSVFTSIAMAFSGAGKGLILTDWKLLLIIFIYGIIGLFAGWAVQWFNNKVTKGEPT